MPLGQPTSTLCSTRCMPTRSGRTLQQMRAPLPRALRWTFSSRIVMRRTGKESNVIDGTMAGSSEMMQSSRAFKVQLVAVDTTNSIPTTVSKTDDNDFRYAVYYPNYAASCRGLLTPLTCPVAGRIAAG
eukprot:2194-Chlamydomonas_euryale.AAC.1